MRLTWIFILLATGRLFAQGWNENGDNHATGNLTVGAVKTTSNYGLNLEPLDNGDAIIRRTNQGSLMISSNGGASDVRFNYSYGGGSGGIYVFDGGTTNNANFNVNSSGNLTIFSSGGFVGIGTSAPDAMLAVKGEIHAQEVKVDLSVPGPDYVFEKSYQLPSLQELKVYVDSSKHLPDVPSANEMEAKGINVGEMNIVLLKKVEELTLYLIKQDEEIQALKKAFNSQGSTGDN